jgi:hypothetical protein
MSGFFLIAFFLVVPVASGLLLAWGPMAIRRAILLAALVLSILGTTLLAIGGPRTYALDLDFFGYPLFLSVSKTPALLYLALLAALLILVLLNRQEMTTWHGVLVCLALPFGFVSFFSGQFMLRYIALEIVGLTCALSAVTNWRDRAGYQRLAVVFMLLRLGDIGLWSAILILQTRTGSLNIDAMLEAAIRLPLTERAWVLGGFLVAVLIKIAVWPCGIWQYFIPAGQRRWVSWLPSFLMPGLGLYLLYRIYPIPQSHPALQSASSLLALALILALLIAAVLKWLRFDRFFLFNSLAGALALFITAYGSSAFLRNYFLILVVLRFFLRLADNASGESQPWVTGAGFLAAHGVAAPILYPHLPLATFITWAGVALVTGLWGLTHQRVSPPQPHITSPAWVEKGLNRIGAWENALWRFLSRFFQKSARFLYDQVEIGAFSRGFSGAGQALIAMAEFLQEKVEVNMERLWKSTGQKLTRLSRATLNLLEDPRGERAETTRKHVQNAFNGHETREGQKSFRWDLIWIPVLLLLILFFLIFSQKG